MAAPQMVEQVAHRTQGQQFDSLIPLLLACWGVLDGSPEAHLADLQV